MLRWRTGCREEPPGSQNHRRKTRRLQHLGVPVQQLGKCGLVGNYLCVVIYLVTDCCFISSPYASSCVWTGAGSVHLQGAVSFFWLRSDIRQVLRPERQVALICLEEKWNYCKTSNQEITTAALRLLKKSQSFPFFSNFPLVFLSKVVWRENPVFSPFVRKPDSSLCIDGKVTSHHSPFKTELLWIRLNHFLGICFLYLTRSFKLSRLRVKVKSKIKESSEKREMVAFFKKKYWNTVHRFQQCNVN